MNKPRIIAIFLFGGIVVLKIFDGLLTSYGLSIGGIELNPMGFNALSITFNVIMILALGGCVVLIKDKTVSYFSAGYMGILFIFYSFVVSHNVLEVMWV